MARPLTPDSQPSPLSKLLDPSAAARAVRPAIVIEREVEHPVAPTLPRPCVRRDRLPAHVKRECVLTRPTDEALTRLTELIRRATGARVNASHAVRSLLNALAPAWPRLEDELRSIGPLRLPSNAQGHEQAREAMEQALSRAVRGAIRSTPEAGG